jgi:acetyl-CoA/propionyl-CoA carboxylase biotin carboxyl carrier protein
VGAGTVEYIISADRPRDFFFMEMNTRLQVEHPVTEMVLGLDLVEWQLRVAAGEPLPWDEEHPVPVPRGHAVEARIYAEDPQRGFLPSSGRLLGIHQPETGAHVRVDSALQEGAEVGTDYDPMLAKVIAWGPDRRQALGRLGAALSSTAILGVATNTGFLVDLLARPEVVAGDLDTDLVERIAPDLNPGQLPTEVIAAAALLEALRASPTGPIVDPWSVHDSWRAAGPAAWNSRWRIGGQVVPASIRAGTISVDGGPAVPARAHLVGADQLLVEIGTRTLIYTWAPDGDELWLSQRGHSWRLVAERETIDRTGPASGGDGQVISPMPGTVVAVHVELGDAVEAGRALVSVEAMKMEHVVKAGLAGIVGRILVRTGESVKIDQPLVVVEPAGLEGGPEK